MLKLIKLGLCINAFVYSSMSTNMHEPESEGNYFEKPERPQKYGINTSINGLEALNPILLFHPHNIFLRFFMSLFLGIKIESNHSPLAFMTKKPGHSQSRISFASSLIVLKA